MLFQHFLRPNLSNISTRRSNSSDLQYLGKVHAFHGSTKEYQEIQPIHHEATTSRHLRGDVPGSSPEPTLESVSLHAKDSRFNTWPHGTNLSTLIFDKVILDEVFEKSCKKHLQYIVWKFRTELFAELVDS